MNYPENKSSGVFGSGIGCVGDLLNFQQFIGAIVLVLTGGYVLFSSLFVSLPEKEDLVRYPEVQVTTRVFRQQGRKASDPKMLVLLVKQYRDVHFEYLSWFPGSPNRLDGIQVGDTVTIWSDSDENNWIWQLESDGDVVVSYEEIRDAIESNNAFDPLLGAGLLLVGGWIIARRFHLMFDD